MDRSSSFFISMLNDLINSYTFNRMGLETLAISGKVVIFRAKIKHIFQEYFAHLMIII